MLYPSLSLPDVGYVRTHSFRNECSEGEVATEVEPSQDCLHLRNSRTCGTKKEETITSRGVALYPGSFTRSSLVPRLFHEPGYEMDKPGGHVLFPSKGVNDKYKVHCTCSFVPGLAATDEL